MIWWVCHRYELLFVQLLNLGTNLEPELVVNHRAKANGQALDFCAEGCRAVVDAGKFLCAVPPKLKMKTSMGKTYGESTNDIFRKTLSQIVQIGISQFDLPTLTAVDVDQGGLFLPPRSKDTGSSLLGVPSELGDQLAPRQIWCDQNGRSLWEATVVSLVLMFF